MTSTQRDDLLPPNATPLERALSRASAIVASESPDGKDLSRIRTVQFGDHCERDFLPWLAWSRSVDNWSSAWHEAVQREAISNAIELHKIRGTRKAVREAIKRVIALAVNPDRSSLEGLHEEIEGAFSIREWFEPHPIDGEAPPLTFEVTLQVGNDLVSGQEILERDLYAKLRRAIDDVKPLSSRYTLKVGGRRMRHTIPYGTAARAIELGRFTMDISADADGSDQP